MPTYKRSSSDTEYACQSHLCILQTAFDLLEQNYDVHVLADGVSSCNREEVPIALARIQQAGGYVTTSESAAFQLQRKFTVDLELLRLV